MRIETHQHYFAVMKAKMGELQAANTLSPDVRGRITFVWELPPLPYNHETSTFGKSFDSHIALFSKRLHESCPEERHCFIDCRQLDRAAVLEQGELPLEAAVRLSADLGAHPSICDEPNEREIAFVRRHLTQGGEVLLRLSPETFASMQFREDLRTLLEQLGAQPSQCHLFFDFEQLSDLSTKAQAFAVHAAIVGLERVDEWLSISIVGGSMPPALPRAEESPKLLPRLEWNIWREVVHHLPEGRRLPAFGDYGVSSYDVTEVNPRLITVSANIRYTSAEGYWIFKGGSLRRFSFEQFRSLSRQIVGHPAYSQPEFSWGDDYIKRCAEGLSGTGNSTTWRRVGTNHHLALVARQIAGEATIASPDEA